MFKKIFVAVIVYVGAAGTLLLASEKKPVVFVSSKNSAQVTSTDDSTEVTGGGSGNSTTAATIKDLNRSCPEGRSHPIPYLCRLCTHCRRHPWLSHGKGQTGGGRDGRRKGVLLHFSAVAGQCGQGRLHSHREGLVATLTGCNRSSPVARKLTSQYEEPSFATVCLTGLAALQVRRSRAAVATWTPGVSSPCASPRVRTRHSSSAR